MTESDRPAQPAPTVEPADTRRRIIDAFASLLVHHGERAATLDAVAERAKVSKGGLLYHFGSKRALVTGLLERVRSLSHAEAEAMRRAPEGLVAHLVQDSTIADTEFDLVYIAATRLAEGSYPEARAALTDAHDSWLAATLEAVGDPVVARMILLVSDGLYFEAVTRGPAGSAAPDVKGTSAGSGSADTSGASSTALPKPSTDALVRLLLDVAARHGSAPPAPPTA